MVKHYFKLHAVHDSVHVHHHGVVRRGEIQTDIIGHDKEYRYSNKLLQRLRRPVRMAFSYWIRHISL